MFESLLGQKEYGMLVYFRDDDKFTFRRLPIELNFYVEKVNDIIVRGWQLWFKLLKRFDGYKGLKAGMVTLAYSRDVALDLYGQLNEDEKPSKEGKLKETYMKEIFEANVFALDKKIKPHPVTDKAWIILGVTVILLAIGLAIKGAL